MASTVAREIVNGATWQSIQVQPYDGERYPCGCHPHPKEPHLRFYLCDYHDGFDAGVDRGKHELRDDGIVRLRAAGDALAQALSDYGYGGDWEVLKAWEEARRD